MKKEVLELVNAGFTCKSVTIKSTSLTSHDTWNSVAMSVVEDVLQNKPNAYGEYAVTNRGKVLFSSSIAIMAILKEIPEIAMIANKLEDEADTLNLLLCGASAKIYQKVIAEGEVHCNPFSEDAEDVALDHEWVCTYITEITLGDLGNELISEFLEDFKKQQIAKLLAKKVEKKRRVFRTRDVASNDNAGNDDSAE